MASPLTTGRTLVTNAFLLIGAVAAGEPVQPADMQDAFARLNSLIDSWAIQDLTALVNERHVMPVTANQQDYLLGPTSTSGGNWVIANRPDKLTNLGLLLNSSTPPVEMPRTVYTDDQWSAVSIKDLTNVLFTAAYYNPTSPNGTVSLWPVPTTGANDVVVYFDSILTQLADITTQYQFPAGYERALRYNLAVDLAPEWGRASSEQLDRVERTAASSLRMLKAANVKMSDLSIDPALSGNRGAYNVYTDGY